MIFYQEIPTGHDGNKYSSHLECYALLSAERFPTFRKMTVPSLLRLHSPIRNDVFDSDGHLLSHNLQVRKCMQEVTVVMQKQQFGVEAQMVCDCYNR